MAVGDIYKVDMYYNIGSELTQNVIHLREKTACTDAIPAQSAVNAALTKWVGFYGVDLFSQDAFVTLIRAIRISPNASVPGLSILGAATCNGNNAAEPVPSTSALLFSLYTDTFTGNGRGRIYVPGLAVDQQNDGQLTDAAATLVNTANGVLESDWTPTGLTGVWELGVWSRSLSTFAKCTQAIGHTNLATIKGRRNFPGIGT